jgi:hypothetical protein
MSAFAEYNPLSVIDLHGTTLSTPKGLIVVVGPNSSGKTLFLKDIESYLLTGQSKQYVVCKSIRPNKPINLKPFFDALVSQRYIIPVQQEYRVNMPPLDLEKDPQTIQFSYATLETAYKAFVGENQANNPSFFTLLGRTLVHSLPISTRIALTNPVSKINRQHQPPLAPIHALDCDGDAQMTISDETGKVFGNALWLDQLQIDRLYLRVSGSPTIPPISHLKDARRAADYREIVTEGDGYRSFVGICMTLLLGIRPVCLIDEPELCLHPPQAYEIGRFIGAYAKCDNHVTFVATHSSHVLRGVLETAKDPQILRLTNHKTHFVGNLVPKAELDGVMKNPRVRAEAILDGIFAQTVAIVEADGDRAVYQAALEGVGVPHKKSEMHLVPVSGTGGFAIPA